MAVLGQFSQLPASLAHATAPVGELLLARIACEGGATRAELANDLAGFVAHKLSPGEWRRLAESHIGLLIASGHVTESQRRLRITGSGQSAAGRFTGPCAVLVGNKAPHWPDMRDAHLIACGLGIQSASASRLKMAARPEGLRTLILQTAYNLPVKKNPSIAKLRAQLALLALERAFGNTIKAGLGKGAAFTAKAGRSLAGQLSASPREFATDQRLITALAAEAVGAVQTDLEALRLAIWRNLGSAVLAAPTLPLAAAETALAAPNSPAPPVLADLASRPQPVQFPPKAANDAGPPQSIRPQPQRPDPGTFATAIKSAAARHSEGWPGNRKAFISHVWKAIRTSHPAWDLSEIEFKCMLAEAHRLGQIVLATADLKDKKTMAAIESSAIAYKNTVWHFVRVEED